MNIKNIMLMTAVASAVMRLAATAVNKQPWHFVAVTDKDKLAQLATANPNAGMTAKAQPSSAGWQTCRASSMYSS